MNMQCNYKGNPIHWKSENDLCIITYNQFAFQNRYTLYLNDRYTDSSDNMFDLIRAAKASYYFKVKKGN